MIKIRKSLLFALILLLGMAGLLYHFYQQSFQIPKPLMTHMRSLVREFNAIDFDAESLKINLPRHIITASKLKIMLPGQAPFVELDKAVIYLASGTGPLDLYFSRAIVERAELSGLTYDATAPQPARQDDAKISRVPAREIALNGLKINTSVSVFNIPDFRGKFIRARRNANVELAFDKGPLGGRGRLVAMLALGTGEAKIKFNWLQEDFSGFIPLIFLSHRFGLNIMRGGAEVAVNYEGNLLERLKKPADKIATFLNKELEGRLTLKNCGFKWGGIDADISFVASRTHDLPWKYDLKVADGQGSISIRGDWRGREESLTDFSANIKGERVHLTPMAFEKLGMPLLNTEPGEIDFSGDFVGDIKKVSGNGSARARNWKYQNKSIHNADLSWSISEDFCLKAAGRLRTEIGNLVASSTTWLAGPLKGHSMISGNLDELDLQSLRPFIESPVAGKCSGPFKVKFDFASPASATYDIHLEMREGKFYAFEPDMFTARIYGTGAKWNISNPLACFPDGGRIALDGLITSEKFAARASVDNVDLKAFGLPEHIASGQASLKADIGGSLADPVVQGELWSGRVGIMGLNVDSFKAQLLVKEKKLTLAPLVIRPVDEALIDGFFSINLLNGKLRAFRLAFQKLPVDFLNGLFSKHLKDTQVDGILSGSVSFDGQRAQDYWEFSIDGRQLVINEQDIDTFFLEGSVLGHQGELKNLFVRAFGGTISASGQFVDKEHFSGTIEAESLKYEKMAVLKTFLPEFRGDLSLQGALDWTREHKSGEFTVFSRTMKTNGRDIGNFGCEITVNDSELKITGGEFDKLGVKIDGEIDWLGRRPYKARLDLDKVDLSFIPEAHGIKTFDYGGLLVTGKCQMQGDLASLTPDLVDMQLETVRIQKENDVIVSNRPMQVIYQNNSIEIRSLELKYRLGILGVEGVFTPGKNVALMINGNNFSLKALGRLFDLPNWDYDGSLSINARLFGDLDNVRLKAAANIDEFIFAGRKIPEVRAKVDADPSGVDIEDAMVRLPGSSFNLKGRVDLDKNLTPSNIDLHLFVPQGPLTDLSEYLPQIFREASGTVKADLHLTGKPFNPRISGDLKLLADQLAFSNMRKPLTNVDFAISTDDHIINIDSLKANLGRGQLNGKGQINFRDALGSITANITGEKLDLSFMNLEINGASASLDISGDLYNPVLTSKVFVPRGKFNITTDLLAKRKKIDFIFDSLNYHVDVEVPRNFWLKSSFLNAEMRGKFSVIGDLENFKLDGGVNCVQGSLYFKQRKFRIETGDLKFGGVDNSLDPHIFVKSEGQIQSTKIFLTLEGRLSSFKPQIYSTPPMSEGDLLALLTIGRDLNSAMQSDSKELFESEILEGLKNSYISALIGDTISSALNLDELFLSSLFDKASGKTRSFIRVGKYVGQNIFMAYEGSMEEGQEESYIFEYRLPKGFVVNLEFKEPVKEQRIGVRYDWKFW